MAESDRGVHPDLLEETLEQREEAAAAPPPEAPAGRRSRRAGARPAEPPPPTGGETVEGEDQGPPASPEAAEWRTAWSSAATPEEAFALLAKNLPREVLATDETLKGFIGSHADRQAREMLRQQERDLVEQRKREAAAANDLYTLGELAKNDYDQQVQNGQQFASIQPMMDVIARFQQTLPENLQREVAGKTFGEGKPWNEGLQEYLSYLVDSATKHRLAERESALRKSILSEINGSEPVPEREGGTPSRVRVVTDEQIAAMSLREFDALFDENGHPRPGVQHNKTRGIPLTQR